MFRVTRAEEQAVRLTMRLAFADAQLTLAELAAEEELPEPMVAKLLGMLRRGGVVEAVRGRNGGYVLARRPAQISAAQVIRSISGDPAFEYPCATPVDCPRTTDCGLRPVWRHLGDLVAEVLERTSVADLLAKEAAATRSLRQLWPLSGD